MSETKVYGEIANIIQEDLVIDGNLNLNAEFGVEKVIDGTFDVVGLGDWVLGAGWSDGTGKAAKAADGTGTLTQAVAINAVVGTTYKIVYEVKDVTVSGVRLTYGGITDTGRYTDGVYTFYVTAKDAESLILTPSSNGSRFSIDNVSVKALTDATGDLTVDGNLEVRSPVTFWDNLTTGVEHGLILSTKGTPFSVHSSSGIWNSVRNDLLYYAYNLFPGTMNTKIEATEPIFKTEIDAHYYNGAEHLMEHNWSYLSIDGGTTRKPLGLDIDRTTHAVRFQFNSGADIPTLRLTDGMVGINTNMVDPVHALTVRADSGNVTLWLQGTDTRYRSGWALAASGLTVNCYDDTGATYLPMLYSCFGFIIYF